VRLARTDVIRLQSELNALGFALGTPDGILGPATRGALGRFQHSNGLVADGHLDQELIDAIGAAVANN